MVTKEDIEAFLDRLSLEGGTHREVEPGLWVVKPGGPLDFDLVVHYSPPVVLFSVKVMDLPADKEALAKLSRRLLELNASDMLHGSYGIDKSAVVITEALELSHLDFAEFLAVYESMTLALASHMREISSFSARRASASRTNGAPKRGNGKTKVAAAPKRSAPSVKKASAKGSARGGRSGGRR